MSINWKVRLRNRQFWLGIAGALGTCGMALAEAIGLGECAHPWAEAAECAIAAILAVLAALGVVVDPTTEGLGDSDQALQYEIPKPKSKL